MNENDREQKAPLVGEAVQGPASGESETLFDVIGAQDPLDTTGDDTSFLLLNELEPGPEAPCAPEERSDRLRTERASLPGEPTGLVLEKLEAVAQQVKELREQFENKLMHDAHKNKIIDELHRELQEYKADLLKKHTQTMITDLIQIVDDIRKFTQHYRSKDVSESDFPKLLRFMEDIPEDIEELFHAQGIRSFSSVGDAFDPSRHRIMRKIETEAEAKDKTVAETVRPGYEWDGKVIRPEMVTVLSYRSHSGGHSGD